MKNKNTHKKIKNFLYINLGVIGLAFSYSFLLSPNTLVTGGVGGMAINVLSIIENIIKEELPSQMENIIRSGFILGVNIVLLILARFLVSWDFCVKTLYCSLTYPLYVWLFTRLYEITNFSTYLPVNSGDVGECTIIVLFSAIIAGFSVGIAIKHGASTGGVDIIEQINLVHFHMPYSTTLFLIDGVTVFVAAIIAKNAYPIFYGILYIYISGRMIDAVVFSGFNVCSVSIITKNSEKVKNLIIENLNRGLTEIDACGGYTGQNVKMIVCIMSNSEVYKMRSLITAEDPEAFLYVNRASEVYGLGFSKEKN